MPPSNSPAPFLVLSDVDRLPDWQTMLAAQPRMVGLVLRDYAHPKRHIMAAQMAQLCRRQGRYFSVAGDARLAAALGAGFHCPSYMLARPALRQGRAAPHDSAAVHNVSELLAAQRAGFQHVLIAPVFATKTHPGARPLGPLRAAYLLRAARHMGLTAYALGGMGWHSWRRLGGFKTADGFAAIAAFGADNA